MILLHTCDNSASITARTPAFRQRQGRKGQEQLGQSMWQLLGLNASLLIQGRALKENTMD